MAKKTYQKNFELVSEFKPAGDQPAAIQMMLENFKDRQANADFLITSDKKL